MEKHHGQIVEYIIRKNGYSITDLAAELEVNRRSIYNYFQNRYLKYDVICKIGLIINHDFSKEFPDLFASKKVDLIEENSATFGQPGIHSEELYWKDKYIRLLESYNAVLKAGLK